jgi:hypothetical protein
VYRKNTVLFHGIIGKAETARDKASLLGKNNTINLMMRARFSTHFSKICPAPNNFLQFSQLIFPYAFTTFSFIYRAIKLNNIFHFR